MEDDAQRESARDNSGYWRENLKLLGILLAIWAACSFGAGIVFRKFLDQFMIGGYPLGFWFAQQGSIYIFLALIVVYSVLIRRIERKHGFGE